MHPSPGSFASSLPDRQRGRSADASDPQEPVVAEPTVLDLGHADATRSHTASNGLSRCSRTRSLPAARTAAAIAAFSRRSTPRKPTPSRFCSRTGSRARQTLRCTGPPPTGARMSCCRDRSDRSTADIRVATPRAVATGRCATLLSRRTSRCGWSRLVRPRWRPGPRHIGDMYELSYMCFLRRFVHILVVDQPVGQGRTLDHLVAAACR